MARTTSRKSQAKSWFLIVLVLFTIIVVIGGTYARYSNTTDGTASLDLAAWHVEIDGTAMNTMSSGDLTVSLTYVSNQYVSSNKLAPGGSATFTFIIDPAGSEVAIDYEIELGTITGLTNNGSAISLDSATYTIQGGSAQSATVSNGVISITESLADVEAGKTVTVVGTILWDNEDDANNAADTENGWADPTPTATVTVTAQQHIA